MMRTCTVGRYACRVARDGDMWQPLALYPGGWTPCGDPCRARADAWRVAVAVALAREHAARAADDARPGIAPRDVWTMTLQPS
jgi:hypothetical protein